MTERRQRYDVVSGTGPTWSTSVIHVRGAFINGKYVPILDTRPAPHAAPQQIRNETNSKPRNRD